MSPQRPATRGSSLFWRIYSTVVLTILAGTAVGAVSTWVFVQQRSERWVGQTLTRLEDRNDALVEALDDPAALDAAADALRRELNTRVAIANPRGRALTGGRGAKRAGPRLPRKQRAWVLRQRRPRVVDRGGGRRLVLFPLIDPVTGRPVAIVSVRAEDPPRGLAILVSCAAVLVLLALGARSLSRSLTSRLRSIESSADRIASGELSQRVPTRAGAHTDELDDLGASFNAMAEKVETVIRGQRTLLTNVSHELRTPIARVRVVLEILEDRAERLENIASTPDQRAHVERLQRGLHDIGRDTGELEELIEDLLTSGRLDLSTAGGAPGSAPVALDDLAKAMAERFDAHVSAVENPVIQGDPLLLRRLLSNLLSNARRACPNDRVDVHVEATPDGYKIAVEDRGAGIPTQDRERVFEPFARLDAARSRDRGGAGLGLHLCRQIARAHGGDVVATSRSDGRSGARIEVDLPQAQPR